MTYARAGEKERKNERERKKREKEREKTKRTTPPTKTKKQTQKKKKTRTSKTPTLLSWFLVVCGRKTFHKYPTILLYPTIYERREKTQLVLLYPTIYERREKICQFVTTFCDSKKVRPNNPTVLLVY